MSAQTKKERIDELEETMQQMAEVDSWQAEVAHLDKCAPSLSILF